MRLRALTEPWHLALLAAALTAAPATTPAAEVLLGGDGLVGGALDAGLVLIEGDAGAWTCHEAIGEQPTGWHLRADGRILAASDAGLLATDDGGCSWQLAQGPPWIAGLAVDPEAPTHLFLSTADGAVHRSWDDGSSWEEIGALETGLQGGPLRVAPGGLDLFVVGRAEAGPELAVSRDGGVTWSSPLALDGWSDARPLLFDAELGIVFLAATSSIGDDWLAAADVDLTSQAQGLAVLDGPAVGAVAITDGVLFVERGRGPSRWTSGEGRVAHDEGPTECLAADAAGALYGCGAETVDPLVHRPDGLAWVPALAFDRIAPRDCPADSPAAQRCPEVWLELVEAAGDDDDDATEPWDEPPRPFCGTGSEGSGSPGPCGCAVAQRVDDVAALTLVALLLFRLRRRSSRR
jgi:hypothetical protein